MRAHCYLECVLIEYAMLEDRLLSILVHLGMARRQDEHKPVWVRKPSDVRQGYRSCLAPMLSHRGSLPSIRSIKSKMSAITLLATLEGPSDECGAYERWLRTTVRDKLEASQVDVTIERLGAWLERRNELVHALFGATSGLYDSDELRALAEEGLFLARQLDNVSGKMAALMCAYRRRAGASAGRALQQ